MRIGEEGQITIPKYLRERFDLNKYDVIEFVPDAEGIRIRTHRPPREVHPVNKIKGMIRLRYADNVDQYIEEIRGK
jgi:AbrB family looped-hinge helix DNA binding protein